MSDILVTGRAGFIGFNLTEELLQKGHRITVLNYFRTGKINMNTLTLQVGDICNMENCGVIVKFTRKKLDKYYIA